MKPIERNLQPHFKITKERSEDKKRIILLWVPLLQKYLIFL